MLFTQGTPLQSHSLTYREIKLILSQSIKAALEGIPQIFVAIE